MPDTKELTWGDATRSDDVDPAETDSNNDPATQSWDTYRNWLSKAPAPAAGSRIAADVSLYTWKGYRSWSDKVKRNWSDRSEQDQD